MCGCAQVCVGMCGCAQVCVGERGCARVCVGVCRYAQVCACVCDEFSEFLPENRVPTSADFNTYPIRIFYSRFKQISDGIIGFTISLFGIGINMIAIRMLSRQRYVFHLHSSEV